MTLERLLLRDSSVERFDVSALAFMSQQNDF